MLEKREGKINEIIYNFVAFYEGKYKLYINTSYLDLLIEEIINCNETTKYISIMPFYRNSKYSFQVEYEKYMFYIECSSKASKIRQQNFHKLNFIPEICEGLTNDEMKILTVLCDSKDVKKFQKSILKYKEYLYSKLPELLNEVVIQYNLDIGDLSYGYFCFEIISE